MKGIVGYLFGSPILIADAFHSGADLLSHVASGFGLWLASRGKADVVAQAQAAGLLAGAVNTIGDVMRDPHFDARDVWQSIEHSPCNAATAEALARHVSADAARRIQAPFALGDRTALLALAVDRKVHAQKRPPDEVVQHAAGRRVGSHAAGAQ